MTFEQRKLIDDQLYNRDLPAWNLLAKKYDIQEEVCRKQRDITIQDLM